MPTQELMVRGKIPPNLDLRGIQITGKFKLDEALMDRTNFIKNIPNELTSY